MAKKKFSVGDKVFAKIKGYPEWPAVILEDMGSKYKVRFYGTGETGQVNLNSLFYYLEYKDEFNKKHSSKKRIYKGYPEAVQEIEAVIRQEGTDGNGNNDEEKESSATTSVNDTIETSRLEESLKEVITKKRGVKRKTSSSLEEQEKKLRKDDENTEERKSVDKKTQKIVDDDDDKDEVVFQTNSSNANELQGDVQIIENDIFSKSNHFGSNTDDTVLETDFKIRTPEYLKSLIEYAENVRKNEDVYKKKPVETRIAVKNQIVVAKMPSGKYIAIPCDFDQTKHCETEYDGAMNDEKISKDILALKERVENGSCNPDDEPHLFRLDLKISETEVQQSREIEIIELMKMKLRWLKIEANLVQLDQKIKQNLGLDKAEPKEALKCMDEMLELDVQPLMLKKQPHVVELVRRLRKYVGNVREWGLTGKKLEAFEMDAKMIQKKAVELVNKFSALFSVSSGESFWTIFDDQLAAFKYKISEMKENQVLALHAEPDSRQTYLDQLHEQDGLADLLRTLVRDKENVSQAANNQTNKDSDGKTTNVVDSTS